MVGFEGLTVVDEVIESNSHNNVGSFDQFAKIRVYSPAENLHFVKRIQKLWDNRIVLILDI
jgi:hypothetical protein